jgi:predicted Zn-ribbon and HTH transcriptional regulator
MATHPQRLRQALTGSAPKTVKELSRELSLSEKELVPLLEKLGQRRGELCMEPARCIGCGFEFRGRSRAAKPSRCPECRSERIAPPRFWVQAAAPDG